MENAGRKLSMQDPAIYRIRQGRLSADWSSRLHGMTIRHSRQDDGGEESRLGAEHETGP